MKRYNRANKKFVLLGLVLPILVFFISYTAVFAYFTSTSRNEIDTSAAIVKIGFKAEEGASKISHEIQTGSTTSSEATIMPGDTLIANATIVNEGNVDVYAIFNFVVNIKKSNGTTEIDVNDFYTFNSDGTVKKLIATNDVYTNEACLMTPNQTIDVSVSKHFKGLFYGNEYKQAQVTYSITAMAIQTVNIGTAVNATNLLINNTNENYSNLQIFGNSIQNGTPSVDTPISIESVGDKTKNLIPTYTPQSKNGLTLDVNNDGSLHIYGTPSENTIFKQEFYNVKPNNYFLSGCPSGGSDSTYRLLAYFKASNYNLIDYGNGKGYKLETESNVVVDLKIYIGQYVDLIFKPMLEVGLTGTEFEPYNKYKIPIQATKSYNPKAPLLPLH